MSNTKEDLKEILTNIHAIAIVGASSDTLRDSFKVMKFLIDYGYKIYPVNPNETSILGIKCYPNLRVIEDKISMVDVFRAKEFVFDITKQAIEINADILWLQEGVIDKKSSVLATNAGLKVVMDECPKKILEVPKLD
ncbi:MAG: CoA-binding protein [Gammaproteobacteria bacterium]|tara:strand:- start:5583 stop:5993 length:411 start_codon:yes stop_codon:yes gene_type:complete